MANKKTTLKRMAYMVLGTAVETAEHEINAARDRRDTLASRLAAAEELLATRKAEATTKALDGASDADLDQAEAGCREVADRIATLQSGLARAEEQLLALETKAEADAEARKREQAARATEALLGGIEAASKPLADALQAMAELTDCATSITAEGRRISDFCRGVGRELAFAEKAIINTLRAHASHIRSRNCEPIYPLSDGHVEEQTAN